MTAHAREVARLFDWLVDGVPGATTPADLIARMGPELLDAGFPIVRIESFVRTLHPHIVGRSFVWEPGRAVQVLENTYAYVQSPEFVQSPAATVFRTGEIVRRRLLDPGAPRDFALLEGLAAQGITDYVAVPLVFLSGQVHAITFASSAPEGFTEAHVAAIMHLMRPLSRVAEIFALSRTAANLLNTYVGHNAGERIMAGHIRRGDTDTLRAVLWFSDLRGFTAMSGALPPGAIIRVLNDLFECQVAAIEQREGEVLKFIGDGLLAIFPLEGTTRSPSEVCDAALDAADDAFAALDALNGVRAARDEAAIRFGLALHVGDVSYGNIGGAGRLDFTCIGPAVNVASRLEGLTSRLDRTVVLSEAFAKLTTREVEPLGRFELKGVAGAVEIFAPRSVAG